ncbi:MAG: hypothetical protein ACE5EW_02870 [Thermoplasmata archaeon]
MKGSTRYALLSILLLAVYIRLLPVANYLYWGGDFGEYFLLSSTLAAGLPLPNPYEGWQSGYPEFLGMEVLVASVSWTGIPIEAAALLVVPILSSLAVVPVFLIGRLVTGRDWPALLAAAIVAVVLPHVYPTSHPIPGAIGDLLFLSSLLLLLRLRERSEVLGLLLPASAALIVVHHLSSYFLIIVTFMIAFLRVAIRGAPFREIRRETFFLGFLVAANLVYWALYTENFRRVIELAGAPWWLPAILVLLLPVALYAFSVFRRRVTWTFRPSFPSPVRGLRVFVVVALSLSLLLAAFVYGRVPGTTFSVSGASILYAIPALSLFLFAPPGRKYFDFLPGGLTVTSWFLVLILSLMLGAVLAPFLLIPFRHVQYLVPALALFAGVGAYRLIRSLRRGQAALVFLIGLLLVLGVLTAIPPREALGNHFEGTRPEGMNAVHWATERVDGVTATDHRASSILFGFGGLRATWGAAPNALHAPTFEEAKAEMQWVAELPSGPGRIDYVHLDRDLVAGATISPLDPALPLSDEAQAKFMGPHYLKLYDDGYAQVYWVNWGTA